MSEQAYLPGGIRERIRDRLKMNKLTQAGLAEKIGSTDSTISRFMSEKTDKLSDENIIKIAEVFGVSTDFLLGVADIPDRKNYDIFELGLSSLAARNLYTRKVNAEVVSRLLENPRFATVTAMIAQYFDETLAAGVAAQNQIFASVSSLLMGQARAKPKDKKTAVESAAAVQLMKVPAYQADLGNIQNTFMASVREIKQDMESSIKPTQQATKDIFDRMKASLTKGQDELDLRSVTPEDMLDAITSTVAGMEGATPEVLAQFRRAAAPLFRLPRDEHGTADQ